MKQRESRRIQRSAVVIFNTNDELSFGERLLKSCTRAVILRFDPALSEHQDPANIVRIPDIGTLEDWLRSSGRPAPATFLLATKDAFDVHQRMMASLASMEVRLPQLLSSGQDQIIEM